MKNKIEIIILVFLFISFVGCTSKKAKQSESNIKDAGTITVSSEISTGSLKWGSIGWLYGFADNTQPPDSMISGLGHPQYTYQKAPFGKQHKGGDALIIADKAKRLGMKGVGIYMQDFYKQWPYPVNSIESYMDSVVDKVVDYVVADKNRAFMLYVPFNEPDWIWYDNTPAKINQFCQDWEKVYHRIKSRDPDAKLVGPNTMKYNKDFIHTFFTYCKEHKVMPDIASWHALENDFFTDWYDQYADFRRIDSTIPVHINEYGLKSVNGKCDIQVPGRMIQFISRFENSKVFANKAYWTPEGTLNDLCTIDGKPTGCWYLYQWYGQMNGNTVQVTLPNLNGPLQAIASKNNNSVKVIFGGSEKETDVYNVSFDLTGLTGEKASYKVIETTYTGQSAASSPTVKMEGTMTIKNGAFSINITNCDALSAYNLSIN